MSVILIPAPRKPWLPRKKKFPFALVTGTPQLILMGPGPGTNPVGIPTIVGGDTGLRIYMAGVDVTCPRLQVFGSGQQPQPVRLESQTIGRQTALFDMYDQDASFSPQLGQTVQITEGGLRLFAGCVNSIVLDIFDGTRTGPGSQPLLTYHITAIDKAGILDHRVLLKGFVSGTDWADAIRLVWSDSTYANPPITQEGITLNNVPLSLGPMTSDYVKQFPTVRTFLDDMTTDIGGVWFVDSTGDLHAQLLADIGACPFSLSTTSPNWRKANMTTSLLEYATKDYAVSDRTVTPSSTSSGPAGSTVTETYTLPQQAAVDRGFIFGSIITNLPILKITGLTVNGTPQPTYLGTQSPNISFRHTWWYFAQAPYLYPPSLAGANGFPDPAITSPDPSPGDVVVVTYIAPAQQSAVVPGDPLAPSTGTCGTGTYEVVEQVKGISVQADLDAIATAALAKRNVIPKTLNFETDQPGAAVGQRISVDIPRLDLAATSLMITSVDGTALSGKLGFDSRFRWQISATNTQDMGNWIKWFSRFIARTENAIAIPRYEEATFVLAPGGSLTSGIVELNPYIVKNTGTVFLTMLVAGVAQTGQVLEVEIISDAIGFISRISNPGGATALQQTTDTVNTPAPLILFQNDILRVSVGYSSIGSNPVPAANVTVSVRISY